MVHVIPGKVERMAKNKSWKARKIGGGGKEEKRGKTVRICIGAVRWDGRRAGKRRRVSRVGGRRGGTRGRQGGNGERKGESKEDGRKIMVACI